MNCASEDGSAPSGDISDPVISIIVPTRNRKTLLLRQVDAVRSQAPAVSFEIIVVDNGSSDGTTNAISELSEVDPRVRLVVAEEQADAAYARNVGASVARASRLAFVDDDDIVGDGWLAAIYAALNDNPLVACKTDYRLLNSPRVTDGWPLTQETSLRVYRGLITCTGHLGIDADLWKRLGGQRTGLISGEDRDLSVRSSRDLEIPPVYVPEAVYHRQLPSTLRGSLRQGRRDGRGRVQRTVIDDHRRIATTVEWRAAVVSYWWILTRAPMALLGRRPYLWMLHLGDRLGGVEQSVRMRAFLP